MFGLVLLVAVLGPVVFGAAVSNLARRARPSPLARAAAELRLSPLPTAETFAVERGGLHGEVSAVGSRLEVSLRPVCEHVDVLMEFYHPSTGGPLFAFGLASFRARRMSDAIAGTRTADVYDGPLAGLIEPRERGLPLIASDTTRDALRELLRHGELTLASSTLRAGLEVPTINAESVRAAVDATANLAELLNVAGADLPRTRPEPPPPPDPVDGGTGTASGSPLGIPT